MGIIEIQSAPIDTPEWWRSKRKKSKDDLVLDLREAVEALKKQRALYEELLYQVGKKFDGETRHQTALRYLRAHEDVCGQSADLCVATPE